MEQTTATFNWGRYVLDSGNRRVILEEDQEFGRFSYGLYTNRGETPLRFGTLKTWDGIIRVARQFLDAA